MKAKNSLPNLAVLVTLGVFGLFSFPVHWTADAKFSPANLVNEPEMAVDYLLPVGAEPVGTSAGTVRVLFSNTNAGPETAAP